MIPFLILLRSIRVYMVWFNFILRLNFIFLCFRLISIHYYTPKQREIKFEPRIKVNHNIYTKTIIIFNRPKEYLLRLEIFATIHLYLKE